MKRVYAARSSALLANLQAQGLHGYAAGLAVVVQLPDGADDKAVAREAYAYGLAPAPLSIWFGAAATARSGLLLGVATAIESQQAAACRRLAQVIQRFA
jgi:GntR family transcriptional regulator/MocR family aminotransferase